MFIFGGLRPQKEKVVSQLPTRTLMYFIHRFIFNFPGSNQPTKERKVPWVQNLGLPLFVWKSKWSSQFVVYGDREIISKRCANGMKTIGVSSVSSKLHVCTTSIKKHKVCRYISQVLNLQASSIFGWNIHPISPSMCPARPSESFDRADPQCDTTWGPKSFAAQKKKQGLVCDYFV